MNYIVCNKKYYVDINFQTSFKILEEIQLFITIYDIANIIFHILVIGIKEFLIQISIFNL